MESDISHNGYEYDVSVCTPQHHTGAFHLLSARKLAEALRKALGSLPLHGGWVERRVPSPSEVHHSSGKSGYRAFSAGNRADLRACSRKQGKSRLAREERLRGYVMEKLRKRWSPRAIVKRLQEDYPNERAVRISHEAVYRYIYVLPAGR